MRWNTIHLLDRDATLVVVSGRFTSKDVRRLTHSLVRTDPSATPPRFIIDLTMAEVSISETEIDKLPRMFEVLGARDDVPVAVVSERNELLWENLKYYESQARAHGVRHRVFNSTEAALGWLSGSVP